MSDEQKTAIRQVEAYHAMGRDTNITTVNNHKYSVQNTVVGKIAIPLSNEPSKEYRDEVVRKTSARLKRRIQQLHV